jgi:hypothetical protein
MRRGSCGALGEDVRKAWAVGQGVFLAEPFYCSSVELIEAGDVRFAGLIVRVTQPLEGERRGSKSGESQKFSSGQIGHEKALGETIAFVSSDELV